MSLFALDLEESERGKRLAHRLVLQQVQLLVRLFLLFRQFPQARYIRRLDRLYDQPNAFSRLQYQHSSPSLRPSNLDFFEKLTKPLCQHPLRPLKLDPFPLLVLSPPRRISLGEIFLFEPRDDVADVFRLEVLRGQGGEWADERVGRSVGVGPLTQGLQVLSCDRWLEQDGIGVSLCHGWVNTGKKAGFQLGTHLCQLAQPDEHDQDRRPIRRTSRSSQCRLAHIRRILQVFQDLHAFGFEPFRSDFQTLGVPGRIT